MTNVNKRTRVWFVLAMLAAVITLSSYAVLAATNYTDYSGNYAGAYKVDGYGSSVVYFNEDMTVSSDPTSRYITFTVTDNKYLAFDATNVLVGSVYVKGGDGYRIYTFDPSVDSASDLRSPLNGGTNIPDISHYGLVLLPVLPPPPDETTAETTAPSETTAETTVPSETTAETTAPSETTAETTAPSETTAETTAPSETTAATTAPSETTAATTAPSETTAATTAPTGIVLGVFREPTTPTTAAAQAVKSEVKGVTKTGESGLSMTLGAGIVLLVAFGAVGSVYLLNHKKSQG